MIDIERLGLNWKDPAELAGYEVAAFRRPARAYRLGAALHRWIGPVLPGRESDPYFEVVDALTDLGLADGAAVLSPELIDANLDRITWTRLLTPAFTAFATPHASPRAILLVGAPGGRKHAACELICRQLAGDGCAAVCSPSEIAWILLGARRAETGESLPATPDDIEEVLPDARYVADAILRRAVALRLNLVIELGPDPSGEIGAVRDAGYDLTGVGVVDESEHLAATTAAARETWKRLGLDFSTGADDDELAAKFERMSAIDAFLDLTDSTDLHSVILIAHQLVRIDATRQAATARVRQLLGLTPPDAPTESAGSAAAPAELRMATTNPSATQTATPPNPPPKLIASSAPGGRQIRINAPPAKVSPPVPSEAPTQAEPVAPIDPPAPRKVSGPRTVSVNTPPPRPQVPPPSTPVAASGAHQVASPVKPAGEAPRPVATPPVRPRDTGEVPARSAAPDRAPSGGRPVAPPTPVSPRGPRDQPAAPADRKEQPRRPQPAPQAATKEQLEHREAQIRRLEAAAGLDSPASE